MPRPRDSQKSPQAANQWKVIAKRYIAGEPPRDIARDYPGVSVRQIVNKAYYYGWLEQRRAYEAHWLQNRLEEAARPSPTDRFQLAVLTRCAQDPYFADGSITKTVLELVFKQHPNLLRRTCPAPRPKPLQSEPTPEPVTHYASPVTHFLENASPPKPTPSKSKGGLVTQVTHFSEIFPQSPNLLDFSPNILKPPKPCPPLALASSRRSPQPNSRGHP